MSLLDETVEREHISSGNRESQAVFACKECGHTAHVNAAQNVLDRFFDQTQPEDFGGSGVSVSLASRANHSTAA